MTTFTQTWNAAYEAVPADTDDASEGALRIRELKRDIRERIAVIHTIAGDAEDGQPEAVPESAGSVNAYTLDLGIASLTTGRVYEGRIHVQNTGATTLNINSTGALAVQDVAGNVMIQGELRLNKVYRFLYNGTNFRLLNPSPPIVTNYQEAGGGHYQYIGSSLPANQFDEGDFSVPFGQWNTVGKTGGSGNDFTWTVLDGFPQWTVSLEIMFNMELANAPAAFLTKRFYLRPTGSSWTTSQAARNFSVRGVEVVNSGGQFSSWIEKVPLIGTDLQFDFFAQDPGANASENFQATLLGFWLPTQA